MSAQTESVLETAGRGAALLTLVGLAFSSTWIRLVEESDTGAGSALLFAPLVGALLTVGSLAWRRRPELPIHDRQSDKIIGTVVLVLALMFQWLLLPRYAGSYVLLHVDVTAACLFAFGSCVFVFGVRRAGRYWPAWLVLVIASPGFLRLAVFALGGGPGAETLVALVAIFAGPVAVLSYIAIMRGPSDRLRWTGPAVSKREAWRSMPLIAVVASALWFAPLPTVAADRLGEGPPARGDAGMLIPDGWSLQSVENLTWAPRMYGPDATLQRQLIRADTARQEWDMLRRPRQAVVQTLTVSDPGSLDTFPLEMTYDLSDARVSPPMSVDLGNGITARYRTVVDDEQLLTWSLLSFIWTRPDDGVQRVSILTVDNHEYDATFPATVPGTGSTFGRMLSLLLRGSASVEADESERKDLSMLTSLGTDLVEAQWQAQLEEK